MISDICAVFGPATAVFRITADDAAWNESLVRAFESEFKRLGGEISSVEQLSID